MDRASEQHRKELACQREEREKVLDQFLINIYPLVHFLFFF